MALFPSTPVQVYKFDRCALFIAIYSFYAISIHNATANWWNNWLVCVWGGGGGVVDGVGGWMRVLLISWLFGPMAVERFSLFIGYDSIHQYELHVSWLIDVLPYNTIHIVSSYKANYRLYWMTSRWTYYAILLFFDTCTHTEIHIYVKCTSNTIKRLRQ